jgi:hypothetical protein
VWPHLDERVAQAVLLEVHRDARVEHALVEADQAIEVAGEERQVVDCTELRGARSAARDTG